MHVPGLRSPYEKLAGIYYVARMIDKIRLHGQGKLPEDYQPNLGKGFDARALTFLDVDYPSLAQRVKTGASDAEIIEWCFEHGRRPTDEQIEIWNGFMRKRGWRDEGFETLQRRLREANAGHRTDIQTMFDYIDMDEDRPLRKEF